MRGNKSRLMLAALLAGVLMTPACQSKSKVQEKPGKPANIQQVDVKDWNEGMYRESTLAHQSSVHSLNQQFRGILFYQGPATKRRVALTYDDGPDNFYTPRILDILKSRGVKGTFFMVGKNVHKYPNMVKRMATEGHALGNHSWDHPRLTTLTIPQLVQEVQSTDNEIQRITGKRPDLFRPPYGLAHARELTELHNLGYRVIDWTVDSMDWAGTPGAGILGNVRREVRPGAILLEHCAAGKPGELDGTLQALPQIIDRLRGQGYEFVTVDTLLRG